MSVITKVKTEVDVYVMDDGSIVLLYPNTPAAEEWMTEHMPEEAPRFGRNAYAVEARYATDILLGLVSDGLSLCSGVPDSDRVAS